jgi:LuxR family quorum sensing-dependent transcriptional regulator
MNKSAYSFEEFIDKSLKAETPDLLFKELVKVADSNGYDKVIFSVTNDGDLPKDKNKLGIFFNYPEDWQKYYSEKSYHLIDPVLKYAAVQSGSFRWSDLEENLPLSSRQRRFFREGEEAGLRNGIGVPLRGPKGQLSGIALASSQKKDACSQNLDLMTAYCNQFYIAYKRFYANENIKNTKILELTKKENQILHWLGQGKTDDEVALIEKMSKHTVNSHVRSIFFKLGVNNRISAVVCGIVYGFIQP